MKRAIYAAAVLLAWLGLVAASPGADYVKVYYFHNNYRCTNCYNMENWTNELIDKSFENDTAAGRLKLEVINTETKGNEHYNNDYQLYTKAVVVTLVKNGKEVKYENMSKVWDFLKSKEKFSSYIKEGIDRYLKEL